MTIATSATRWRRHDVAGRRWFRRKDASAAASFLRNIVKRVSAFEGPGPSEGPCQAV